MRTAPRVRSLSIRTRLAATYALVLVVSGAALIAVVYSFMRYVPAYAITSATSGPATTTTSRPLDRAPAVRASSGALTLTSASDILHTLLLVSVVSLTVLALVGSVIGWVVAGRALRPLQDVEAAAARAAAGDLSHRIDPRGPDDEVRRLAVSFDRMLDQLERSFSAHKHFSANAAHELRTPLSATRAILDIAATHPGRTDVMTLVHRLREPTDRSADTVSALLVLAEIDAAAPHLQSLDVGVLAGEVVAEHRAGAASAGITVHGDAQAAWAATDPALLRLAVDNLVRNAVRHNHRGGRLDLTVRQDGADVLVRVDNTGPVIDADVVHLLTQPFYRVRERVRDDGDGLGLGLALVEAVARALGGDLALRPHAEGGLRADLTIPGGSAPPPRHRVSTTSPGDTQGGQWQ